MSFRTDISSAALPQANNESFQPFAAFTALVLTRDTGSDKLNHRLHSRYGFPGQLHENRPSRNLRYREQASRPTFMEQSRMDGPSANVGSCFVFPDVCERTRRRGRGDALRVIVGSSEAEAQQILDRLKKGEDFGILAKDKSIDPNAEDYGYLGRVDVATLRPELREA